MDDTSCPVDVNRSVGWTLRKMATNDGGQAVTEKTSHTMSSPKQKKSPRVPRLSTKKTPRNATRHATVSRKLFQASDVDAPKNADILSPKNPKLHEKFNTRSRRSTRRGQKVKDDNENVDSTNVVLKTPTNKARRGVRTRQRADENNVHCLLSMLLTHRNIHRI